MSGGNVVDLITAVSMDVRRNRSFKVFKNNVQGMERNAFQGKVDIHIIVERAHKSFLLSNPLVNDKAADENQTKEVSLPWFSLYSYFRFYHKIPCKNTTFLIQKGQVSIW